MKALASEGKEGSRRVQARCCGPENHQGGQSYRRGYRRGRREEYEVAAKAVVIGTGGYGNNKEWIRKYTGFELGVNMIPVGNVDKMGDGIRMAWEAGAAEEGMGLLELVQRRSRGTGVCHGEPDRARRMSARPVGHP